MLFTSVLLKKKAENSQNMATNIRLFLNQCNKILLNVNVSTSFTLFSYILCILFVVQLKITANSKTGELIHNCGKYRVNIMLDDKTLQYFNVPIAYQIQQIILIFLFYQTLSFKRFLVDFIILIMFDHCKYSQTCLNRTLIIN